MFKSKAIFKTLKAGFLKGTTPKYSTFIDYFIVGIALLVFFAPLFCFTRIPTQDGPLHVDTAAAMLNSLGIHREFIERYLEIRWLFETNTLGHDLLLICLWIAPSPIYAEKYFQFIYLTSFAGGLAYFLTAVRPEAWRLVPLGLPLAYSYLFHLGFYNSCLSICGFLWCWGSLLRCLRQIAFCNYFTLSLVLLLTWLSHPVGFVAFAIGALFWIGVRILLLIRLPELRLTGYRWAKIKLMVVPTIILLIPFAAQFVFLKNKGGVQQWDFKTWSDLTERLLNLSAMDSFGIEKLKFYLKISVIFASATALLGFLGATKLWQKTKHPTGLAMWTMTLFYLTVFYTAPTDAAGSGYINERVMPCIFFFIIAILAATSLRRITELPLLLLGLGAITGLQYIHWPVYAQADKVEQDYLFAVNQLPPESILFNFQLESNGFDGQKYASYRVDFTVHLAGFYTAATGGIYINNIIARWNEQRQIGFKTNVQKGLSGLPPAFGGTPTTVDFGVFADSAGRPVDYVLIYGNFARELSLANYYEQYLKNNYECSLVSPLGLVKLCKRVPTGTDLMLEERQNR